MQMNTDLIKLIQTEIKENGLPGEKSHLKMTPYRRLTTSIPENPKLGAVLLLLYKKENDWFFPLTERKEYDGVHSRQMSFPGGKVETEDSSFYHAAIRETEEEIGINREHITRLTDLSKLYIPPSNFMVHPYVGVLDSIPIFVKQEEEVESVVEVSLNELMDDSIEGQTLVNVRGGMKMKTPYFHLQDKVVWGATAAILSEFKDILKKFA